MKGMYLRRAMVTRTFLRVAFLLCMVVSLVMGSSGLGICEEAASKKITIGVAIPTAQNNQVQSWFGAIEETAKVRGMNVISVDDQLSVEKQVADIDMLTARKVEAIFTWPLDPKALGPALRRAKKAGILTFATDHNVIMEQDPGTWTVHAVLGRLAAVKEAIELISQGFPNKKNINVVTIGLGVPVAGPEFLVETFRDLAIKKGFTFLERQDNPTDDAAGARPLVVNMLTKHSNIDVIYCYNDPSAIGASAAVRSLNKKLYKDKAKEGIMILGYNGNPAGVQAVKDGKYYATWNLNGWATTMVMTEIAYQILTGQMNVSEAPREILIPSDIITKENMDEAYVPWAQSIKDIREGKLDLLLKKFMP